MTDQLRPHIHKTVCQHCGHFTPVLDMPEPTAWNGLHLLVDGKPHWVMPAMLRDWMADVPGSPTVEDGERTARLLRRIGAMAAAIRAGQEVP